MKINMDQDVAHQQLQMERMQVINFFILSVKRFFINYAVTLQQNFNLTLVVDICCFPKIILKVMKQSDMETMAKAFTASG